MALILHLMHVATEDLGGVPVEEVEADLAAIAEGLPQLIDLSEATAAYVIYCREQKETRASAIKSARGDLPSSRRPRPSAGPGRS